MKVEYQKRAKGGYYAYVTPEDEMRGTYCVIVEPHTVTSKVGVTDYWTARMLDYPVIVADTRKDAVRMMAGKVS